MIIGRRSAMLLSILAGAPALAQDASTAQQMQACRAITDPQQRLACYDRQAGAVANTSAAPAPSAEEVAARKRAEFGLSQAQIIDSRPKVPDPARPAEIEVNEVAGTVAAVTRDILGRYTIRLSDGARWRQREADNIREPRVGDPVRIRRAALGSFFANIKNERAVRFERLPG